MHWAPFTFNQKQYDLTHLHPRTVTYVQPAKGGKPERSYKVDVIFSLHCFTRGPAPNEVSGSALLYGDDREVRIFDFQRYELSRRLPGIIGKLMSCKCYHTRKNNFFTVHILDDAGRAIEYEVYFAASRSPKRGVLNLFVQSAYVRDQQHSGNRPHMKSIGFHVILFNTLNKLPIKIPK